MKLSNLKTEHIIRYRNGNLRMVLKNTATGDKLIGNGRYTSLSNYTEDMLSIDDEDFDIIEAFEPISSGIVATSINRGGDFNVDDRNEYKIIWKRFE